MGKSTNTIIKIAFLNIKRDKKLTFSCFSAIAIAVILTLLFTAYIDGTQKAIDDIVKTYETGHIKVVSEEFLAEQEFLPVQYPVVDGSDWREVAEIIKQIEGVKAVLPRITTTATMLDRHLEQVFLWGIDIESERDIHHLNSIKQTDGLVQGRMPAMTNECAIGIDFAQKTGLTIGDRVLLKTLSAQYSDRIWHPQVVGIFDFDIAHYNEQYIVVDHERLQRLLSLGSSTQALCIFIDELAQAQLISSQVQDILGEVNIVSVWSEHLWVVSARKAGLFYQILSILILLIPCILIVNAVLKSIYERTAEITLMNTLGMSRSQIVSVFVWEAIWLVVFGTILGIGLGAILIAILLKYPFNMCVYSAIPTGNAIFLQFCWMRILQIFVLCVIGTIMFTLIPTLCIISKKLVNTQR